MGNLSISDKEEPPKNICNTQSCTTNDCMLKSVAHIELQFFMQNRAAATNLCIHRNGLRASPSK